MKKRTDYKEFACGRTKEDCHLCCTNSDHTWRSNRLILTRFRIIWFRNRPKLRIHYKIVCKKCGHTRQSGNCFGINVIKELLTGQIYF